MTKVSMRVDYTLDGYSITDQIRIAKEAGADAVETGELKGYDCEKAAAVASNYNIPFVACGFYDIWNARVGAPFLDIKNNLVKTIECAKELGTNMLLSLTVDSEDRGEKSRTSFVENMLPVVELCEKNDMTIVLEPHSTKYVNPLVDMSKYFLNSAQLAAEFIERIGSNNLKMLFDFYHIQTMEGDIMMKLKQHLEIINHFHLAGVPERDEPMNGELNYRNIIKFTNELGYDKYYGLEYFPTNPSQIGKLAEAIEFIKND